MNILVATLPDRQASVVAVERQTYCDPGAKRGAAGASLGHPAALSLPPEERSVDLLILGPLLRQVIVRKNRVHRAI